MSLRNPLSEFEKDIFKAILANDGGLPVEQLLLIGKRGAAKRLGAEGPKAIIEWAKKQCGITVEVRDLM